MRRTTTSVKPTSKTKVRRTASRPLSRPIVELSDNVEIVNRLVQVYGPTIPSRLLILAELGLTQMQIASAFGVSIKTIESWLYKYEECKIAYDKGKWIHDFGVQKTLLKRALGYEYEEVRVTKGTDSLGREYNMTVTTTKHVKPDVTAEIFWLKNRHKGEWADVNRTEFTGNMNVNVNNTLKLDSLSEDERALVQSVALKQIASHNGATS